MEGPMATDVRRAPSKVTYATMMADRLDDVHRELDRAVAAVKTRLGEIQPMYIAGTPVSAAEQFEDRSPIDTRILVGRFQSGTREHVHAAVAAAREAFPAWASMRWDDRVDLLRRLAQVIHANRVELTALMGYESGKTRLECLGDIEESADLIEYYCRQFEEHDGFIQQMEALDSHEQNLSVLRPYGVWAVISPFNFPLALAAGPAGAALVSGNTVVFKPASDTPLLGLKLYEMAQEAGIPAGVFNVVTGLGDTVGQALIDDEGVDGVVFTGSTAVGMKMIRDNARRPAPRPLILEMGGKNPAIVMKTADLEKATMGIGRSAFSAQGQKCSACSRVYVHRDIKPKFIDLFVEKLRAVKVGNPLERGVAIGPVINEAAVRRFEAAVAQAKADGGRIVYGGRRLRDGDLAHGYYVEPTVIDNLRDDCPLLQEELFVPLTIVCEVASLDEAIQRANNTEYGLTAGLFSEDDREIERFYNGVQAGVLYVNRKAGATTGAWPGVNPFGGWKASGLTGRGSGGPYYVQQFMHEQSRVRVR
jgi:1-pyrroline-5-carboxylate dehydrogenase